MTPREQTKKAVRLARRCYPILAGVEPEIQGAALCDLVARHLAGHVAIGDEEATRALREAMLEVFIVAVRQVIPIVDAADIQPELKRRMQ